VERVVDALATAAAGAAAAGEEEEAVEKDFFEIFIFLIIFLQFFGNRPTI
jgi:hypothetical protein